MREGERKKGRVRKENARLIILVRVRVTLPDREKTKFSFFFS